MTIDQSKFQNSNVPLGGSALGASEIFDYTYSRESSNLKQQPLHPSLKSQTPRYISRAEQATNLHPSQALTQTHDYYEARRNSN